MAVNIVKDNISEDEAFELEKELIHDYVYNRGYGIDIHGYRTDDSEHCLTNLTFGGDGSFGMVHSEEWCKQHSEDMSGSKNPMYGINLWATFDEEKIQEIKNRISNSSSGEKNPMYKVSPKDRMTVEKYKIWRSKTEERLKNQLGSKNPNAKTVELYHIDGSFIKEFDSRGECAEYLIENFEFTSSLNNIRSCIGKAIKLNKPYKNYIFK